MSALKRKSAGGDAPTKSTNKRQKAEKTDKSTTLKAKPNEKKEAKDIGAASKPPTLLVKEQPAFPRGGAGLLTPLERKQIQAKAVRDAVAEQQRGTDLFGGQQGHAADSEEDDDISEEEAEVAKTKKQQKKASKKSKTANPSKTKEEKEISIEGLNYKRLAVGSLILGSISSVNAQDVAVALPNNLTGFVPLTAVSATFTAKLQKALESKADDSEDEEDGSDDEDIELGAHFHQGQLVRVCVTSLGDDVSAKPNSKKRIELSLDPQKTNPDIRKSDLIAGTTIQGAVSSVEDHGLVLDIGTITGESSLKGFVPSKALGTSKSLSDFKTGAVLLCTVTDSKPSGKVVKLSPDLSTGAVLKSAPTIDPFLPGTLVEVLISEVASDGLVGKILGMLDATADVVHSGACRDRESFLKKYKIGQKVKGRLVNTFPLADKKKLGFSLLEDVVNPTNSTLRAQDASGPQISSVLPTVEVVRVVPGLGIYVSLPSDKLGFAHISRLSDKKVDSINETLGPYKTGSQHKARVLDYNTIDDLYILSLEKKVIEQRFLRLEDVPVGQVVMGTVERLLVGANGVQGVIVNLADGISGMAPQIHLSDITLLHPEKKFREGGSVTVRVLSVDKAKRQIRLTLKKTLINSDQKIWTNIDTIEVGNTTVGTLIKVESHGAIIQFFGNVRGYLPVSEMSEAYIKDAKEHFKVGQVLTVNAISVKPEENRLTVSCREQSASLETDLASVEAGSLVAGTVFEKSQADLLLRLESSGVIARLSLDHVSDGSERKRRSALDKIRVGQKLEDVLVLDVKRRGRLVNLTNKQTLVKAAKTGQFLKSFEDLKEDILLTGFVSNITEDGVFVGFAGGISGLIPKRALPTDAVDQPDFNMQQLQAVTAKVSTVDYRGATPRFWLTMREASQVEAKASTKEKQKPVEIPDVVNAADASISSFSDFKMGAVTKARISSIKATQINVELAKDIQGRIDISELFDDWSDIKDRKQPLKVFSPKQVLDVRILGAHDTRNHRFLPLTHRSGKNTVFELSAKPSIVSASETKALTMSDMTVGSSWLAYVNNVAEDHLMVNISPSIRGRVKAIDISDDLTLAADLENNFPIGSAIRVRVLSADQEKNRLDLTGKSTIASKPLDMQELAPGMILPGRVTRISDRSILVQLSENLVGATELIDMADDYDQADVAKFQKNDIVRVAVLKVDAPNKKIVLSTRPSKVLSSSLKVADPEVISIQQLKVNDVVRGFITNVTDKGLFVMLGHSVTAFVPIRHLSDLFLKNWKDGFQRDQLVRGKIILADHTSGHVQLSLKESLLNANYVAPRSWADFNVGDIVTGKVAKVEEFGVFILADNSQNVRGLCHRSEVAEKRVPDVTKLFNEGDVVKAKVLKIDIPNRRINFGMKASYFSNEQDTDEDMHDNVSDDDEQDSDIGEAEGGVDLEMKEPDDESSDLDESVSGGSEDNDEGSDNDVAMDDVATNQRPSGLSVGGFDWYGMPSVSSSKSAGMVDDEATSAAPKKKKKKPTIQTDLTGDLDANGPQSSDDFERLLLGSPDSSLLWLQYMAFNLELGDIDTARTIGERALKSMGLGQDTEKLHIWVALLNLENAYGDDESLDATFKRACEYNDSQDMHTRLVSILIQSGKHSKADDLFEEMLKKFTQDPKIYINYATFLFDTMSDADKGRALLPRALRILPQFTHFDLTSKFAQLEFKSSAGLAERGRTIFEGLINSFPKRTDLFNVMLDMEMQHGSSAGAKELDDEQKEQIRSLFERIIDRKLKPKRAQYFFKRWLAFEEEHGDERKVDAVKSRAAKWVKMSGAAQE